MTSTLRSEPTQSDLEMETPPNWVDLPPDLMSMILHRLGAIDILGTAQAVCTTWRRICKNPAMWRVVDFRNSGNLWEIEYNLEKMATCAVDRSSGELVDINIEYFGTDELLSYISDRSNQLHRLRLVSCNSITSNGLVQAVKKLPLLEDIQLFKSSVTAKDIEVVGNSCPLLKSFKLNYGGGRLSVEYDGEALAIATSMPGLRRLQLFGNNMTNDGLKAILDGCSHLESLDLRQCFNVDLGGSLGKRCSEQIKDLRQPHDSTEDYEFDFEIYYSDSYDEEYPDLDLTDYDSEVYEFYGGSDISGGISNDEGFLSD